MGKKKKRVVVAMSGGVDSSTAAYLLKEAGYEVIGISMQLYDHSDKETRFDSCCSLKEVDSARRVAQILDIPYYVLNFEPVFKKKVVDYFIDEYLNARTPNPCVKCNEEVKFKPLLLKAKELKADYLATGHYVQVHWNEKKSEYQLKKAKDPKKDQSYFLFSMERKELPYLLFPLGELTKLEVRNIARSAKLPNAEKEESMEICFIPNNDYAEFIHENLRENKNQNHFSGKFVNKEGKEVGEHNGFFRYTVGQRKGLELPHSNPLYVLNVEKESRNVRVGSYEDLWSNGLVAKKINWITLPSSNKVSVRIRHRHKEIEAHLDDGWQKNIERGERRILSSEIRVHFQSPLRAVTPGQAAVFYEEDTLLGGGWIEKGCH